MTTIQQEAQEKTNISFIDGVRVLFLIHRNKEGGSTNNDNIRKIITTNREEYQEALIELLNEKQNATVKGIPLRIYASVNDRNIDKAIREFKQQQLDADYYDADSKYSFYYDIKNRFISALMKPSSRSSNNFLLDIDREDLDVVMEEVNQAAKKENVVIGQLLTLRTKNGWHVVTTPFNPAIVAHIRDLTVNKDGLILLSY